jgi:hypothetical protein
MNVEDMFTDRRKSTERRRSSSPGPSYIVDLKWCDRIAMFSVVLGICLLVLNWWLA